MNRIRSGAAALARHLVAASLLCVMVLLPFPVPAQGIFVPSRTPPAPLGGGMVTGQITGLVGPTLQITLRSGRTMTINLRTARAHDLVPPIYLGEFVQVQGKITGPGAMTAAAVMRAKSAPAAWFPDTP
jgi:hypothetical protein